MRQNEGLGKAMGRVLLWHLYHQLIQAGQRQGVWRLFLSMSSLNKYPSVPATLPYWTLAMDERYLCMAGASLAFCRSSNLTG